MQITYTYSESTIKPPAVEKCKTTVYLRKDFAKEEREDEQGNKTSYWTYREAKLTHEAFDVYTRLITAENAIKGADDSGRIKNTDANQLILMNAIADLYDVIAGIVQEA
jgi:hypothetical protein